MSLECSGRSATGMLVGMREVGSALDAAHRLLSVHRRPVDPAQPHDPGESCAECGQRWPCDSEVVATALVRASPK